MLFRNSDTPCPADVIAIAVNIPTSHCGLIYSDENGTVTLCDFQNDAKLAKRSVPANYYWTKVRLGQDEEAQLAALAEVVYAQNATTMPYSYIFTPHAIDVVGRLRAGAGCTCATFVVNLLEAMNISLVAVSTWRARPVEDDAARFNFLRDNYYGGTPTINAAAAARLASEVIDFRIKPSEVCGAATMPKYPANFVQAKRAAEKVRKIIDDREKPPAVAVAPTR